MKKTLAYAGCFTTLFLLILARTDTAGSAAFPSNSSLAGQVTIRRDTYGVPHIMAETEEAAAFGMGYAQAEDHCVEIARRFIAARGEEAKHLGTGVESDFAMKRYGNYEVAKKSFSQLTLTFQQILRAFAAGFNLYVDKHRKELPGWIAFFDAIDVHARCRAEVMRFALREAAILNALQTKYPANTQVGSVQTPFQWADLDSEREGAESLRGSNMWALSGSRTVSGKPILLGNPHQPWVVGTVDNNRPMVGGGDGWIMTVEFSKPVVAYSLLAYGQTSNVASRHSTDQVAMFAEHKLRRIPFTEGEIRANLRRSYHPGGE